MQHAQRRVRARMIQPGRARGLVGTLPVIIALGIPFAASAQVTQTIGVRGRPLGDASGLAGRLADELRAILARNTVPWSQPVADTVTRLSNEFKGLACADTLKTAGMIGSTSEARCLWLSAGPGAFNVAQVGLSTERGSIYAELLSTTFGTMRASLGTMVSASDSAERSTPETVQRLVAGGGNIVLGLQRPTSVFLSRGNRTLIVTGFAARVAADFEELGADVQEPAVNGALSAEVQFSIKSDDQVLELFGEFRLEALHGSADFYRGLGLSGQSCCLKYARASIGATVLNAFVITWSRVTGGSDPIGNIGGQITITARRQSS